MSITLVVVSNLLLYLHYYAILLFFSRKKLLKHYIFARNLSPVKPPNGFQNPAREENRLTARLKILQLTTIKTWFIW